MKELMTGGVLPMMTHLMDDARETLQMRDKRIAELEAALQACDVMLGHVWPYFGGEAADSIRVLQERIDALLGKR